MQAALSLDPLENGDIVTVHAATPNTVFVGGLVNVPRPQMYPQGVEMTVLQAIAGAAGLRTDVTPREATLIRRMPDGTDAHVRLNLDRITRGQDPNLVLAAGDILWVPDTLETIAYATRDFSEAEQQLMRTLLKRIIHNIDDRHPEGISEGIWADDSAPKPRLAEAGK